MFSSLTAVSRTEHREIEPWLDRLHAALKAGDLAAARTAFAEAWARASAHYGREDRALFAALRRHLPVLAVKMEAQHAEAREYAAHLVNPEVTERDWLLIARRYWAISQHNIIEEERDVFSLADRLAADLR